MFRNREADDSAFVDCIAVADSAFLCCRIGAPQSGDFLGLLVEMFVQVNEAGTLLVNMPATWLVSAKSFYGEIGVHAAPTHRVLVADLPPDKQRVFWFIELAARELQRLSAVGAAGAIRSLGYAVHPLCALVQSDEAFDAQMFQFNLRIAAFHWSDLSAEMQDALCNLASIERAEAVRLLGQKNFTIDMYGKRS